MKYSFNVPKGVGHIADTRSRAPLGRSPSKADIRLTEDLNLYVSKILECLPASEWQLEELILYQQGDELCRKHTEFCIEEWPEKSKLSSGLLVGEGEHHSSKKSFDERLATYFTVVASLGYSRQNALGSPRNSQVSFATTCPTCCKHRENHSKPMIQTIRSQKDRGKSGHRPFSS